MLDRKEVAGMFFLTAMYAASQNLIGSIILLSIACVSIRINDIRDRLRTLKH